MDVANASTMMANQRTVFMECAPFYLAPGEYTGGVHPVRYGHCSQRVRPGTRLGRHRRRCGPPVYSPANYPNQLSPGVAFFGRTALVHDDPLRTGSRVNPDHLHGARRIVDEVVNPATRNERGGRAGQGITPAF